MVKRTDGMAICYGFDDSEDFWARVGRLARDQEADEILAYMKLMVDSVREALAPLRREDLHRLGAELRFFPGVSEWFSRIYASGFMFDEDGTARWPALAINYTTKTQYLFRINKGSLDVFDNSVINKFLRKEDRPLSFERIVYIGDGESWAKQKAEELISGGRATLIASADYREGSVIDTSGKGLIDKIAAGV